MRTLRRLLLAAAILTSAVGRAANASAQSPMIRGADAVASFTPGAGRAAGQGPEHFPTNVLGAPDPTGRREVGSSNPVQILSLGLGGEIVLRFDRVLIVNGPGPDFTVFENAFIYARGDRMRSYIEPGEVSVSRDGVTFTPFQCDALSLSGCAGVTPTYGDANPSDPGTSGGNSFDLADIGVDSIRFVRIRDRTSLVRDDPNHPYYDPTLNGFDLDAVVAVNIVPVARR